MTERNRKQDILQSARILFRDKGYHATTIRDIAVQAGMLSGSLYAHIRTKEDLLFEITEAVAEEFLHLRDLLKTDLPPEVLLRDAFRQHVLVVTNNLDAASVFLHDWSALHEERRATILQMRDEYEGLWTEILKRGVSAGLIAETDIWTARILILSAGNWVYQWYDKEQSETPEALADRMSDVLLHGIFRRQGR